MIAFMTIIYVAAILVVFKVLKVPPRPWPIAIFVVAGVLMIGTIVVLWTLAAPISTRAVVNRYVVQIVPYVKGQVTSIPAKPNVPLKKGDVLYTIDPTPYQYALSQIEAQIQAAKSNVLQAEAGLQAAQASIAKANAELATSTTAYEVAETISEENPLAISKLKLVQAEQQLAASQATVTQAMASESQAKANVAAAKDSVVSLEAQRDTAQFNLTECVVRAPTDGFITDWQIREGTFVVPMPMAAAGTFIDTTQTNIVASFPAQMLVHVKPGQKVELAFKCRPGELFLGTVENVIQATGEGQEAPGGKLPSAAQLGSPGILAVKFQLNDSKAAKDLEMGAPGAVAIYTDWGKSFGMISKVTIRLQKWAYFLPIK
jgi:multidrug resistance efflux pump